MKLIIKNSHILFFVFFFSILMSCSQVRETSQNSRTETALQKKYELLAKEKFKENYAIEFSSDKSYALCLNKENLTKKHYRTSEYFVYDLKKNAIIYEETIGVGSVKWLNNHQLEISIIPGIVRGDEKKENTNSNYIYDLKLKKKILDFNNTKEENDPTQ